MTVRPGKGRCRVACLAGGAAGGLVFFILLGFGPATWGTAALLGLGAGALMAVTFLMLFCRAVGDPPVRGSNTGRPLETGAPMGEVEAALAEDDKPSEPRHGR
ncbi:hypothetical protein ACXN5S_08265 [Pseudoroseicyclus sp. H15]